MINSKRTCAIRSRSIEFDVNAGQEEGGTVVVKKDATMTTKDRDSTSAVKTTVFLGVINFWYDVEGRLSVNHIVSATSESYQRQSL